MKYTNHNTQITNNIQYSMTEITKDLLGLMEDPWSFVYWNLLFVICVL